MSTETAIAVRSTPPPALYEVEENLAALLDTEALVTEEQRTEFALELQAGLKVAKDKRDRVAQFVTHCKTAVELATSEIARLRQRQQLFEKAADRLEGYVVGVIQSISAPDAKGKYPKLEGHTSTLAIQRNPSSVVAEDEAAIPLSYKDAELKTRCPADRWAAAAAEIASLCAGLQFGDDARQVLDLILDPKNVQHSIRKSEIKKAIEAGESVAGADLQVGEYRLVVK